MVYLRSNDLFFFITVTTNIPKRLAIDISNIIHKAHHVLNSILIVGIIER